MEKLVYDSLNEELFHRFPDLQKPQYAELMIDAEDGPYIVFGTLFNRYLSDLVESSHESMKKAALFLEEMAVSKDERVTDMLTMEVLPTLLKAQTTIDSYWPLLGAATRHRLRCLPPRFSRKVQLPAPE
jgi:hypothetical protein